MSEVERRLQSKLSSEEYELASQLLGLPVTRIREFVEGKMKEALSE